jgi:hypothetical protein
MRVPRFILTNEIKSFKGEELVSIIIPLWFQSACVVGCVVALAIDLSLVSELLPGRELKRQKSRDCHRPVCPGCPPSESSS